MFGAILGSVSGAVAQNQGAKKAAKASAAALAEQKAQQERVWSTVDPYLKMGEGAAGNLANPQDSFKTSPGYEFRLNQGLDAVGQNQAVNGLLRSGGAMKALNDYGQGMASNEYNTWWGQQQGLVNSGLSASGIGAGAANQTTAAIGTNANNQGNAAMAQANAWSGLAGQMGGFIDGRGVSSVKKG